YRLGSLCPGRAPGLITLTRPTRTLSRMRRCSGIRPMGGHCCGGGSGNTAQVTPFLVIPGGLVVDLCGRVETRVQTVFRQLETLFHDESCIGEVREVFVRDAIILDCITDYSAKEGDIRSGANL